MFISTLLVFLCLAIAETLNGLIRVFFIRKYFTTTQTQCISFTIGTSLAIALITILLPVHFFSIEQSIISGIILALLITFYDIIIGRIFHVSWKKILSDFHPRKGYLIYGLIIILCYPFALHCFFSLFYTH